jgi:hypothetical protein
MSKEVHYFSHDCNARNDEKILALRMKRGLKESLVNEIVNYCGVVGLFDRELLTRGSVSNSTQEMSRCGTAWDGNPVPACVNID